MKVLLWLMIPVAALIVGIVWAYFINRPPRPAAMQDSMDAFSRFRHALASDPASRAARRANHARPVELFEPDPDVVVRAAGERSHGPATGE
jgi:hypothetical protein